MEIQKNFMPDAVVQENQNSECTENAEPKRVISGFTATMIVVASMVGTGVFTTTGFLLETTPSAPAVLWGWLIGGIVAFFGALSYAELVAMYPKNGGEYQLLSRIFHPAIGFVAGFVSLIVGFSAPIASAAMAFGTYAGQCFPGLNQFWAALIVILLLSSVHAIKVTWGTALQNVFTVLKILLVSSFIIGGLALGDVSRIAHETASDTGAMMLSPSFAIGLIFVTYAYTGWNGSAYLAGEIKNPKKSLPKALALGTALVTLIYLGLNTVFLAAAPIDELSGKIEVGAVAATALFGNGIGQIFSAVIALLLVSSLSAMIMAGPRIYRSMGDDYKPFRFLKIRKGDSGPFCAIFMQAAIAIIMLFTARFDQLITYIGFTLSACSALTVLGVFIMRKRAPKAERPYKCWGYPVTPALFILLSLWMIVFTFVQTPEVAVAGTLTIIAGLIIYFIVRPKKLNN
ncbi:MAG: amino acid permease [Proteobacteria bacterium]|nr:amino acid permease [Pseudomonadota bacterium]